MSSEVVVLTRGPGDTRALAATVAGELRAGDVVALSGELGAGKTCFVQGAAAALGVVERVTSPSFLLRRDYAGDVPVLHLDVYRLDALDEVADIGFDDALDGARVTFVEWGDAMSPLLPADHLAVELSLGEPVPDAVGADDGADDGAEQRRVRLRGHGRSWHERLGRLRAALDPAAGGPSARGGD